MGSETHDGSQNPCTGEQGVAKRTEAGYRFEDDHQRDQQNDEIDGVLKEIIAGGVHIELSGRRLEESPHDKTENSTDQKSNDQNDDRENDLLPMIVHAVHGAKIVISRLSMVRRKSFFIF